MARAFWSGTITFGLVSVPVDLLAAHRPRPSLRLLDERDGAPLRREFVCPEHGKPVTSDEIVRGYPLDSDDFVVVTDEELDALQPEKTRDINLSRFVDARAIEPLYFRRTYFLVPSGRSAKAYRLLTDTMAGSGRAGIATFVMRGKEYLVAIFAQGGLLRATTLRFQDELREIEDIPLPKKTTPDPKESRHMARQIDRLAADELDPSELEDESMERLLELVKKKRARGRDVVEATVAAAEAPRDNIVDLMKVLKERIGKDRALSESKPAPRRAAARPTRAPRAGKKAAVKHGRAAASRASAG